MHGTAPNTRDPAGVVTPADHKKVGAPLYDALDYGLYFIAFDNNSLNFTESRII